MATAYEIEKVFYVLEKEVNKVFIDNGLNIRVSQFNIKILSESKMIVRNCDGLYIYNYDEIQLRRALFTHTVKILNTRPYVVITSIPYFKKLKVTLIHEIGHSIHYNKFNLEPYNLQTEWDYGDTNYKEKFAVAFQEYLLDKKYNNGIKPLLKNI